MKDEKSLAMSLIEMLKALCKKLYTIIIILIIGWILTIGAFVWYINQFDYNSTEEYTNTTDSGGNACIGDNCNNGDGVQKDNK